MSTVNITIKATGNAWDAPVYGTCHPGGHVAFLSRATPANLAEDMPDGGSSFYYPHAVVLVNGELTQFDQDRQPKVEPVVPFNEAAERAREARQALRDTKETQ